MFVIDDVIDFAKTVINKIFPDKTQSEKDKIAMAMSMATQEYQLAQGQQEINKVEAANSNLFVSGWRPFIGWTCGFAFAWQFVIQPIVSYLVVLAGADIPALPVLDSSQLNTVLFGLLGLGAYRSYEKIKGVTK